MLFGWTYGLVVFCSCSIFCPIFSCIVCFFLSAGRQQRDARARQLRERLPVVNKVIDRLNRNKKQFTNLSQKAKSQESCIICMEEFKADSEISELTCDERHIFHTTCLQEWMKQSLICPLCKTDVQVK